MEFITFFTKSNQVVFDPMAGTGSTLVAALRCGRQAYGIELNPAYAEIARQVIAEEIQNLGHLPDDLHRVSCSLEMLPAWQKLLKVTKSLPSIMLSHLHRIGICCMRVELLLKKPGELHRNWM